MHISNFDTSVPFTRSMDSQEQYGQRIEDTVEARRSAGASYAHSDQSLAPEPERRHLGGERRSRSKDIKELRQLGAVDFHGTIDPAEAKTWLKRTKRVFVLMGCTREDRFELVVSLLQGDAYDWWETVPGALVRPPVMTYDDFLREFRDKYMPEVYRDEKQREFLTLRADHDSRGI